MALSKTAAWLQQLIKARIREELTVAHREKPELQLAQHWNVCAPLVNQIIDRAFAQAQETMLRALEIPLILEDVQFPVIEHRASNPPIHVHMATNWNTLDYAYYAMQNLSALALDPTSLRFNLYCLDARAYDFVRGAKQFSQVSSTLISDDVDGQGSEQHAQAIKEMLWQFSSDAHNIIADSDVVVFATHWDEVIRSSLMEHDLFGVGYPQSDEKHCYAGLPSLTWLAFKRGLDVIAFDPTPQKDADLLLDSPELSALYGLPVGTMLNREVGWQLPSFVRKHGLKCVNIDVSPPIVFENDSPFLEYRWKEEPFLAHMMRSVRLPFRMSQRSRRFYDGCERYFTGTTQ